MQDSLELAVLIQQRLDRFIDTQTAQLTALGKDTAALLNSARKFLSGGKRFRAQALALGYQAITPLHLGSPLNTEAARVVTAASALELFHAAALIHDDIIDRSATRRGHDAVHTAFSKQHINAAWRGNSAHFGVSAAILLGDLLQSWADQLFQEALTDLPAKQAQHVRSLFEKMRVEVAFGQYFDVLEEQYPEFAPHDIQMQRITQVLTFKSAKYSVADPLVIGAAFANATPEAENALLNYGIPVGIAFQLRDDIMGVFGDTSRTGKPVGDDLLSGKRTFLVALARAQLTASIRGVFDELFGNPDLSPKQLKLLQNTITDTGALTATEETIAKNLETAFDALTTAHFGHEATQQLIGLAKKLAYRDS